MAATMSVSTTFFGIDLLIVCGKLSFMILKAEHEGRIYKWIEKGSRATLVVDDVRQLWWGEVGDPRNLVPLRCAPLEILLQFSILRKQS